MFARSVVRCKCFQAGAQHAFQIRNRWVSMAVKTLGGFVFSFFLPFDSIIDLPLDNQSRDADPVPDAAQVDAEDNPARSCSV